MTRNTDLAIENCEMAEGNKIKGVEVNEKNENGVKTTTVSVNSKEGEESIGKPIGKYITAEIAPFTTDAELFDGRLEAVAKSLLGLLPKNGLVLVAGLGNDKITPDALGPKAIDYVLATRHIEGEVAKSVGLENLRGVATIVPGVLGQTGMETGEIIKGIADAIKPSAVIVIDALASMSLKRLGCTIQMSNAGIVPGSGVGNHRFEITEKTIGAPVIAVGIPTVVDGATLVYDLLHGSENVNATALLDPNGEKMIVTPREIDAVIERGAKLIGMGINVCLQQSMSAEDLFSLVG